jgi:choline dehydrogenase
VIGSPHILQTSGLAIPNISGASACRSSMNCAAVGKNMQDHYVARISLSGRRRVDRQWVLARSAIGRRGHAPAFTGKGMLTDNPSIVSHRRIRYAARCRDANFASVS